MIFMCECERKPCWRFMKYRHLEISSTAVMKPFWSSDPKAFRFHSFGKPNTYAVESTPAKFSKLVVKRFTVSLQTKAVQHVYRVKTSSKSFV